MLWASILPVRNNTVRKKTEVQNDLTQTAELQAAVKPPTATDRPTSSPRTQNEREWMNGWMNELMERRCDRVMNGKEGKEENETSCAYLKETRGHGSAWHAVVGGHVAHYGAGGCCCTLGNRQREQVSTDITQPWYNTNITPTLLWFWRDMIYSALFGSPITIWHQNTGFENLMLRFGLWVLCSTFICLDVLIH